nr:MAG TPA: hypothetical protein [Inoviridae sp.]
MSPALSRSRALGYASETMISSGSRSSVSAISSTNASGSFRRPLRYWLTRLWQTPQCAANA